MCCCYVVAIPAVGFLNYWLCVYIKPKSAELRSENTVLGRMELQDVELLKSNSTRFCTTSPRALHPSKECPTQKEFAWEVSPLSRFFLRKKYA